MPRKPTPTPPPNTQPLTADEVRSRIIEVRKVRFADILPHESNPKIHGDFQRQAFRGAVRQLGFTSIPRAYYSEAAGGALVWADGHLRGSEAAGYTGEVAILDLSDAEAALMLVTEDPIAQLAEVDAPALDALLREIQADDPAIQTMLADMATKAGLYADGGESSSGNSNDSDSPEEKPAPNLDPGEGRYKEQYGVIVICESQEQQEEVYNQLVEEGYEVKVVVT